MDIEKFFPVAPEFKVKEKSYQLRKVGALDHAWLIDFCGDKNAANAVFAKRKIDVLCRFAYRLLPQDAREDFQAREVTRIDDDGVKRTFTQTGAEVLVEAMSEDELEGFFGAITAAMRKGNPEVDAAIQRRLDEEKKTDESPNPPTGGPSTTSSPASTDTPSKNSGE
jgi:hypothetical protein